MKKSWFWVLAAVVLVSVVAAGVHVLYKEARAEDDHYFLIYIYEWDEQQIAVPVDGLTVWSRIHDQAGDVIDFFLAIQPASGWYKACFNEDEMEMAVLWSALIDDDVLPMDPDDNPLEPTPIPPGYFTYLNLRIEVL